MGERALSVALTAVLLIILVLLYILYMRHEHAMGHSSLSEVLSGLVGHWRRRAGGREKCDKKRYRFGTAYSSIAPPARPAPTATD